jgi:hypothetical protein
MDTGFSAEPILRQISQLKERPPGWDSYDADPIEINAVSRAQRFVADLERAINPHALEAAVSSFFDRGLVPEVLTPSVGASADGGVVLVWRHDGGRHKFEAFFGPGGEDRYVLIDDRRPVGSGHLKDPRLVPPTTTSTRTRLTWPRSCRVPETRGSSPRTAV